MADFKHDLYHFMRRHRIGVIASVNATGLPQAAVIGFAITEDLEIVFDTLNTTRKYANLKNNPRAALVIGWDDEITVQYEGEACELSDSELAKYKQIYFQTYPDGPEREKWPGIAYFVVRPTWARFSDFTVDPPRIVELDLP